MDFSKYIQNLNQIYSSDSPKESNSANHQQFMTFLLNNAQEKRQLQQENDNFIAQFVDPYYDDVTLLDENSLQNLLDFRKTLMDNDLLTDVGLTLKMCNILYRYYKIYGTDLQILTELNYYSYYETLINNTRVNIPFAEYKYDIKPYFEKIDTLDDQQKSLVMRIGLRMSTNWIEQFEGFTYEKEYVYYIMEHEEELLKYLSPIQFETFYVNMLVYFYELSQKKHFMLLNNKPPLYWFNDFNEKQEAPWLEFVIERVRLFSEATNDEFLKRRNNTYCLVAEFLIGKISHSELITLLNNYINNDTIKMLSKKEQENSTIKWNTFFYINGMRLNLLRYYGIEKEGVMEEGRQIIKMVFEQADKFNSQYHNDHGFNLYHLSFDAEAFHYLNFEEMHNALKTTVFMDKSLFIHCKMVKSFAKVLALKMLQTNPQFFNNVIEQTKVTKIIDMACDLHDTGKYFCLAFTEIYHRSLTDFEYEIVQEHPTNFGFLSKNLLNASPETQCIIDCAMLHHRWYNEQGGYPQLPHTKNKPFVSIISVADSMDAALDSVGRIYKKEKTVPQIIEEIKKGAGTLYDPMVAALFNYPDVCQQIEAINSYERSRLNKEAWDFEHS